MMNASTKSCAWPSLWWAENGFKCFCNTCIILVKRLSPWSSALLCVSRRQRAFLPRCSSGQWCCVTMSATTQARWANVWTSMSALHWCKNFYSLFSARQFLTNANVSWVKTPTSRIHLSTLAVQTLRSALTIQTSHFIHFRAGQNAARSNTLSIITISVI